MVEKEGSRVFVDPDIAMALIGKELDVEVAPGGRPVFTLIDKQAGT